MAEAVTGSRAKTSMQIMQVTCRHAVVVGCPCMQRHVATCLVGSAQRYGSFAGKTGREIFWD